MSDQLAVLHSVIDAVAVVVATDPDPTCETPCGDWTYSRLLAHLVDSDRALVGALSGAATSLTTLPGPDPHQPDPAPTDYRLWSTRLAEALDDAEVRAGTVRVPVGLLTGEQVIVLRSVEHALHGWDLAKAAGAATLALEPAAHALEAPARALLAAVGSSTLGERRPFAAPVPVDPTASALDRLVAAFGRDPAWSPDPVAGYARVVERFAGHGDVELPDGTRRGFGADGLRVDHQVFACTHRGRLMLKLPTDEVDELIDAGLGEPLAKPGQRPMREWVLVPFDGAAAGRAGRAYAFVSGQR